MVVLMHIDQIQLVIYGFPHSSQSIIRCSRCDVVSNVTDDEFFKAFAISACLIIRIHKIVFALGNTLFFYASKTCQEVFYGLFAITFSTQQRFYTFFHFGEANKLRVCQHLYGDAIGQRFQGKINNRLQVFNVCLTHSTAALVTFKFSVSSFGASSALTMINELFSRGRGVGLPALQRNSSVFGVLLSFKALHIARLEINHARIDFIVNNKGVMGKSSLLEARTIGYTTHSHDYGGMIIIK